jgi:DNA-binding NtrC family response regulator
MSDKKIRVLLVDDEPIVGKRLQPTLEKAGYEVETFVDSRLALVRLAEQAFEVVVTDIRMSEIDGLQVLQTVMQRNPGTKVIIITGYATMELAREAMTKGACEVLAKPFQPKDLLQAIARVAKDIQAEPVAS